MDTRTIKSQVKRAWVLTWEIRAGGKLDTRLEGILDASIPSTAMLKIIESLYVCCQLTAQEQLNYVDKRDISINTSFIYMNDGSLFKDEIVCSASGKDPDLLAYRAYNIAIYADDDGVEYISWREKRLIAENGRRKLDYWEDRSLPTAK